MIRKIYFWLSVFLTAVFVALGLTVFFQSYQRLWETVCDLGRSAKYYICEIFQIEHSGNISINEFSSVFGVKNDSVGLPDTAREMINKTGIFWRLVVNANNLKDYSALIGKGLANFAKILTLLMPFFIAVVLLIRYAYMQPNNAHNRDTKPLKAFKGLSKWTYQPIKRFVLSYREYLRTNRYFKKGWIWIWLANMNLLSIIVAFAAFYSYFAVSFDFVSIYRQFCKLVIDLQVIFKHFPWWSIATFCWLWFLKYREKIALNILQHHEARNCGFIKELPIVAMSCGSMGKRKTTHITDITDMSLSQTVMFRQEAFTRLQKQDMKFPFFPWICFENELKACMAYGRVYNLASIRTWVAQKRERYEKHGRSVWQLYGYDTKKYGLYFDNALKREYLFDVLETYAKLYFIYVIESSLLVANYSIREEDILYDEGNFPLWSFNFFPKRPNVEDSRFAHILDFDALRLGKKVIENNPKAGSFEFGVVVITEVGKERANNLELKEVKKNTDEANQKNDLFNAWLKMCRHSATVDNFPFIKVFTDEQRPESWGADARDLADILTIVNGGTQKLALPFYTIEEMLYDWAFSRFISMYYDFRYKRGDNTLLVYMLKIIVSKIWARNERIYNRFGYSVLSIEKERGTQDNKPEKKRYFLANYKIYRERFTTDCFSDYFNDLALKSGVGLMDYLTYKTVRASVDELKAQNSYFINGLYGV